MSTMKCYPQPTAKTCLCVPLFLRDKPSSECTSAHTYPVERSLTQLCWGSYVVNCTFVCALLETMVVMNVFTAQCGVMGSKYMISFSQAVAPLAFIYKNKQNLHLQTDQLISVYLSIIYFPHINMIVCVHVYVFRYRDKEVPMYFLIRGFYLSGI